MQVCLLRGIFFFTGFVCFLFCSYNHVGAQAVQTYTNLGLEGGRVNAIAVHPTNPDKIFAATYLGDGLYLSEDGGNSWTAVVADGTGPDETFRNHEVFDVEFSRCFSGH